MITTLLVFGAGGDLTARLLRPAVAALQSGGAIGPDFRFLGADRHRVAAADHFRADVTDPDDVAAVLDRAGPGPVVVYLALPTQLMLGAVRAVQAHGLPPGSRIAVEKPFGEDAASAAELNRALAGGTESGYRVDHALAMTAVQQLAGPQVPGTGGTVEWSSRHIAAVELLWEETLALEGRASFYDRAGALRDVVQNHLVQLLCTVAQPAPGSIEPAQARASVLRAVRPLDPADVARRTRRARYTAGRLADGRPVPDYTAEPGVDGARHTETFAEVVLELDTDRWVGTRFVLRAGKALAQRRRGVLVRTRPEAGVEGDAVWLDVDAPADDGVDAETGAYRRIVADLLGGGTAFAVGAEEVELAWQVMTPVLRAWSDGVVPLTTYPAGSG